MLVFSHFFPERILILNTDTSVFLAYWYWYLFSILQIEYWYWYFSIWKSYWILNTSIFILYWSGLWEKVVWADSEQLFWVVFSIFHGQKKIFFEFILHCSVRTEKLHKIKLKFFKKNFGKKFYLRKTSQGHSPQPKIDFPYHEISGPDICSLICDSNRRNQNCRQKMSHLAWTDSKIKIE